MQILLIRHGQSEADLLDVHEGKADFPLIEAGREQTRKMARRVKEQFPHDFPNHRKLLAAACHPRHVF